MIEVFQFTHPGGVRRVGRSLTKATEKPFQFTHPGGVRQRAYLANERQQKFQFTHPGGVRRALIALPSEVK